MSETMSETTTSAETLLAAIAAEHELSPEHRAFLGPDFPAIEWWTARRNCDVAYRGVFAAYLPFGKCIDAVKMEAGEPPVRVALLVVGDMIHECDQWTAIEHHGARVTVAPCAGGWRWHSEDR